MSDSSTIQFVPGLKGNERRVLCSEYCRLVFILIWVTCVVFTWLWEVNFGLRTHNDGRATVGNSWPADSGILRSPTAPTLLLFVHPRCSCTSASVTELSRLVSEGGPRKMAFKRPLLLVVATIPETDGEDWLESPGVLSAVALSDRDLIVDRGGVIAERFGVVSSGTIMLFDEHGDNVFLGGITASRGHVGENTGLATLRSLLNGEACFGDENLPVFGCRLCLPEQEMTVHSTDSEFSLTRLGVGFQCVAASESASCIASKNQSGLICLGRSISQNTAVLFLCDLDSRAKVAVRSAKTSLERGLI